MACRANDEIARHAKIADRSTRSVTQQVDDSTGTVKKKLLAIEHRYRPNVRPIDVATCSQHLNADITATSIPRS